MIEINKYIFNTLELEIKISQINFLKAYIY